MKKIIISLCAALLIIALVVGIAIYFHHHATQPKTITSPSLVELSAVKTTLIPNTATATGNLVANQSTIVSPKTNGYVTAIDYQEGEHVKAGQVLIQLDNQSEKENLKSAETALALSQLQYDRNRHLLKRGLITHDVYYNAKVAYQKNQAAVTTDKTNLANKTITAPFDGIIGARNISVGDFVSAGSKLTNLVDIAKLRVEYSLPTIYLSQLKLGQSIIVTPSDLPNEKFIGKVSYISPSIDPETQTITVHAVLNNKNNELKPGEFVNITQKLGPPKKAILIPTQSLFASLKGYYVYSVKNNKAIKIPVHIGKKFENTTEITKGLSQGNEIVVAGQQYLSENKPVKIINAHNKESQ